MAQSLITTVDIFRAYGSNFPHGEDSTHWNVMDTAPWELKSGLFLFSALVPGVTISGIDVICVNLAGPAETGSSFRMQVPPSSLTSMSRGPGGT